MCNAGLAALLLFAAWAAVTVFRALSADHASAGALAGQLFECAYGAGVVVALLTWVLRTPRRRAERIAAGVAVVLAVVLAGVLAPLIALHGAGLPIPFALLHGAAGVLHLALAANAAVLAWMLSAS